MNKNISDELLAVYAEGQVTPVERYRVRQYLAENPQEFQSVLMMMDGDYDLDLSAEDAAVPKKGMANASLKQSANNLLLPGLTLSAAAFVPHVGMPHQKSQQGNLLKQSSTPKSDTKKPYRKRFNACLNELLDEII